MFIISPRIGLCNQLQTIIKGILLAIKYNRDIYINQFQIDLKSGKLTDINKILNIHEINQFLENTIKTPIKILTDIDANIINKLEEYCLPNIDYKNIATNVYINDDIELNRHMEIIYLGNIVSLDTNKSFNCKWGEYTDTNFYYLVMNNIIFHPTFYTLKDVIKQELKLTNFNCIHLRIEDDALKHFSYCYKLSIEDYNKKIIDFYENAITNILSPDQKIYMCSGMLEFDNTINLTYYENLMKNTLLCDKKNIVLDDYYLHNRELIAIIDLLISLDSDFFVGCHISSFSQVINAHHKYYNKNSILFHL
jgi:hypothetical protein